MRISWLVSCWKFLWSLISLNKAIGLYANTCNCTAVNFVVQKCAICLGLSILNLGKFISVQRVFFCGGSLSHSPSYIQLQAAFSHQKELLHRGRGHGQPSLLAHASMGKTMTFTLAPPRTRCKPRLTRGWISNNQQHLGLQTCIHDLVVACSGIIIIVPWILLFLQRNHRCWGQDASLHPAAAKTSFRSLCPRGGCQNEDSALPQKIAVAGFSSLGIPTCIKLLYVCHH